MKHGALMLKVWMERQKLSQRETAEHFGWNETFLSKIMRRHRTPGLANAIKIERETGIPVEAWMVSELDETAGAGRGHGRKRN